MPGDKYVEIDQIGIVPPRGHFSFGTASSKLSFNDADGNPIPGAAYDLDETYSALHARLQYALYNGDRLAAGNVAFTIGNDDQAASLLKTYAAKSDVALLNISNIEYRRGHEDKADAGYSRLATRGSVEGTIGQSRVLLARGDFDAAQFVLARRDSTAATVASYKLQSAKSVVERAATAKALTTLDSFLETALDEDYPEDTYIVTKDQQTAPTTVARTDFDTLLSDFVGSQLYHGTSPYYDGKLKNLGHWRTQYRKFKQTVVEGGPQGRMAFRITRYISLPGDGFQFDYALQQIGAPGEKWARVEYDTRLREKAKEIADRVYASVAKVLA